MRDIGSRWDVALDAVAAVTRCSQRLAATTRLGFGCPPRLFPDTIEHLASEGRS